MKQYGFFALCTPVNPANPFTSTPKEILQMYSCKLGLDLRVKKLDNRYAGSVPFFLISNSNFFCHSDKSIHLQQTYFSSTCDYNKSRKCAKVAFMLPHSRAGSFHFLECHIAVSTGCDFQVFLNLLEGTVQQGLYKLSRFSEKVRIQPQLHFVSYPRFPSRRSHYVRNPFGTLSGF